MENSETETKKNEQPTSVLTICPCCQQNTLKVPASPDPELLDTYMACIMSGVPFWRTYDLYNGKISVDVTVVPYNDAVFIDKWKAEADHIKEEHPELIPEVLNVTLMFSRYMHIKTISCGNMTYYPKDSLVKHIEEYFKSSSEETDKPEAIKRLVNNLTDPKEYSAISVDILDTLIRTHTSLYEVLMATGFDQNFWKGIKLAL